MTNYYTPSRKEAEKTKRLLEAAGGIVTIHKEDNGDYCIRGIINHKEESKKARRKGIDREGEND